MSLPFARLYDHLHWADRNVLESLRTAQNPPARAIQIFSHVLGAEHVWLARILGNPATIAVWPSLNVDQCEQVAAENAGAFRHLVAGLTPEFLEREISYRNSAGASFVSTVEDILTHVALHGSYHRGQVAVLLRGADETPAPTDYIGFVRGAPAATRAI